MRDYKNNIFKTSAKGSKNKSSKPKTKGFGYQILGFGSGVASAAIYPMNFLVVAGGGGSGHVGGGGGGGYRASGYGPSPLRATAL